MREEIKSEPKGLRTKIKRADDEDIKFGLLDILFPPLLPIKEELTTYLITIS